MECGKWAAVAALAVFSGVSVSAGPIVFNVNGVFSSGATFSGSFTLDGSTNSILSSSIVTQADRGFAGATYTSSGTGSPYIQGNDASVPNDFTVGFFTQSFDRIFFFWLSGTPASFTGGPIQWMGASCGVGQCTPSREISNQGGYSYREVVSGTVEAVPEPSGLAAGALAIIGLCASQLRRSHHRRRS